MKSLYSASGSLENNTQFIWQNGLEKGSIGEISKEDKLVEKEKKTEIVEAVVPVFKKLGELKKLIKKGQEIAGEQQILLQEKEQQEHKRILEVSERINSLEELLKEEKNVLKELSKGKEIHYFNNEIFPLNSTKMSLWAVDEKSEIELLSNYRSLRNLSIKYCQKELPSTLINLTELELTYYDADLPNTFVNLTKLSVHFDKETNKGIPKEFVNLTDINTNVLIDINDFPNLQTLNGEDVVKIK